jgi:hypothetical protein
MLDKLKEDARGHITEYACNAAMQKKAPANI